MGGGAKDRAARHATISRVSAEILVVRCGSSPTRRRAGAQRRLEAARQEGAIPDVLLLLEHPPVYTRGRRSTAEELPMGAEWYEMQGIEVRDTDRGGRVTYHGPGPAGRLPDRLAGALRRRRPRVRARPGAGGDLGARRARRRGEDDRGPDRRSGSASRKIGSIGVHVSRGVTTHGLAINVNNDLQPFEWIVPCGIEGCRGHLAGPRARRRAGPGAFADTARRPLRRGLRARADRRGSRPDASWRARPLRLAGR